MSYGVSEYNISLGNNDFETRKKAEADFITFWNEQAKKLVWFQTWDKTLEWSAPFARWFVGGMINASYNALDIHQKTKAEKPAILWEGENGDSRVLTYKDLWIEVQQFWNHWKVDCKTISFFDA